MNKITKDTAYQIWKERQERLTPYPTFELFDMWLGRIGRSTVQKYLSELVREGRAIKERVGKQYRYRIV
jgi:hypothetical protein